MNPIKFLDLNQQYKAIKDEIDASILAVLNESAFVGGRFVRRFEENFAAYQQAEHCVGVGNGTDALEIALEALDLPPGSEIIVPANSFIASSEAVSRSGHVVVFCDVNPDDYTIDVADARRAVTDKTAAIIAVHLYGHPCDMEPLLALASEHRLRVIEDCAQAHGAEYKGARVGALGHIGAFSFYPGKNLGAYGDAGCIVTNDAVLAERCRMIANHGRLAKYEHEFEGRNSRLDGIQAAVLDVKLRHLDAWTDCRIAIAQQYLEELIALPEYRLPVRQSWAKQVYHLFVVQHVERNGLALFLKQQNVQTGIHYPTALPDLPAYSKRSSDDCELPVARRLASEIISLPIGEHLQHVDVARVVDACRQYAKSY